MIVFSGAREGGKVWGERKGSEQTNEHLPGVRWLAPYRHCRCASGTAKALPWYSKLVSLLQNHEPRRSVSPLLFLYSLWCVFPLSPPPHIVVLLQLNGLIVHVNDYLLRFQITTAKVSPRPLARYLSPPSPPSPPRGASGCFHDVFARLVADVSIAAMLGAMMPLYPTVADDGGMFCSCAIPSG